MDFLHIYLHIAGCGQHWHLVDCTRWWPPHVAAIPPETAPHMEELSHENLHGCTDGGQLYSDEEGSQDVLISSQDRSRSRGCRNGKKLCNSAPLWPFSCKSTCLHCHQRALHYIDATVWAPLTVYFIWSEFVILYFYKDKAPITSFVTKNYLILESAAFFTCFFFNLVTLLPH